MCGYCCRKRDCKTQPGGVEEKDEEIAKMKTKEIGKIKNNWRNVVNC